MGKNRCLDAMVKNRENRVRLIRARRVEFSPQSSGQQFPDHYWEHLLSGSAICLFTVLGYWHHPIWLAGSFLVSIYLMVFAVLGECPLITALSYMLGVAPRRTPPNRSTRKESVEQDEFSDNDWWTMY